MSRVTDGEPGLPMLKRYFERVCFARDSREEIAKGALSEFPYMGKNWKGIFIGRE